MVGAVSAMPIFLVLYGLAPNLAWMALDLMFVGAFYMLSLSSFSTIAQTLSPPLQRGRVLSINNAILGVMYPLGTVIQGWLGDRIGLRQVTIGAGLTLGAVLVVGRLTRPGFTASIQPPKRRLAVSPAGSV